MVDTEELALQVADRTVWIRLIGPLDHSTAPALKQVLARATAQEIPEHLVLAFGLVTAVDRVGLDTLAAIRSVCTSQGITLRIIPGRPVREALDVDSWSGLAVIAAGVGPNPENRAVPAPTAITGWHLDRQMPETA
ncbi:MAG TPA: STAS domain-containing protein [Pseudonocardiaceae bacterium]